MNIRLAEKDECKSISSLIKTWCDEMKFDVLLSEIEEDLLRMLDVGRVILAIDNDEIVGIMCGNISYHFWLRKRIAHEHWFFVREDKRNSGIGRILTGAFEVWAKYMKCSGVMIYPNSFGSVGPDKIADGLKKIGYNLHGFQMRKEF